MPDFSEQQRVEEIMMRVIPPGKLQGATNREHMLMGTLTQLDTALTNLDEQVRNAALQVAHEKFGLANDRRIVQLVEQYEMISPFVPQAVSLEANGEKLISYGLSSFGYDLRVADEFEVFTPVLGESIVVDPKNFDRRLLRRHVGDICMIPPNSFALARSVEFLKIPPHVLALCLGKSTYARCGINCMFTPFEPAWDGHVTIEIANNTPLPAKVYAGEGIAQALFFEGERPNITYADRKGKYQGQKGITPPRV